MGYSPLIDRYYVYAFVNGIAVPYRTQLVAGKRIVDGQDVPLLVHKSLAEMEAIAPSSGGWW